MSLLPAILGVAQLAAVAAGPADFVNRAYKAVETDNAQKLEQSWTVALRRAPAHPGTLLGLATIARLTFRDSTAEALYGRVAQRSPVDAYTVTARLGLAGLLANSRTPAVADSALALARREAQRLGLTHLEAEALVAMAFLRARSVGTRAALELIKESRRVHATMAAPNDAMRSCAEGSYAARLGDSTTERQLAVGLNLAFKNRAWRVMGDCLMLKAQLYEHRGSFDRAIIALDTAVTFMRMGRSQGSLAIALQWGAFIRLQLGDIAQSRSDYLEALALSKNTRNAAVEAWALTGLGQIGVILGDLSGGSDYLSRAMTLHRARNDRWGFATVRELQGELNDALGDVAGARDALTEAVAVQTQLGQQLLAIAPLRRLARLELSQGRLDDADRTLQKATQYAVSSRDYGWMRELPYHQAGLAIARGRFVLADSLLRVLDAQQREIGMHRSDVRYNLAIRHADLASRQGDWTVAESWMARAGVELEQWRNELLDKDVRMRAAQARRSWGNIGEEFPWLISRLAAGGRVASALALAESVRARELTNLALQRTALSRDNSRLTKTVAHLQVKAAAPTLAQIQRALDDSTALLAYTAGHGQTPTTLFVITKSAARVHSLAPVDSIAVPLQRLLRLAADGSVPTTLARELGDALLVDAVEGLPASVSRLLVVPELGLFRVPFDVLRLSDGRFAAERFRVAIAPSVTLALTRAADQRRVAGSLLAFGDATYGNAAAQFASPAAGPAAPLPRLYGSGNEARRVARYSANARVLLRAGASEHALREANLKNVAILHFATHAFMDDRSLPRNVLALAPGNGSDGLVGPDDLSALDIEGTLVFLSGCRTAGGLVLRGEGLRGLTAPLLEAGARAVIATHWAIGDASALPFVDRVYAYMARGNDVGSALQQAKVDAIRAGVNASVWAAFSLVGDGTMRVALQPITAPFLPWVRTP